jgi:hypothetical protein
MATIIISNKGLSDMQTMINYGGSGGWPKYQPLAPGDSSDAVRIPDLAFKAYITVYNQALSASYPDIIYNSWTSDLNGIINSATAEKQTMIITLTANYTLTAPLTYYKLDSALQIEIGDFSPLFVGQIKIVNGAPAISQEAISFEIGQYAKAGPGFQNQTIVHKKTQLNPLVGSEVLTTFPLKVGQNGWYLKLYTKMFKPYYICDLQDFIAGDGNPALPGGATTTPQVGTLYGNMRQNLNQNLTYYISQARQSTLIINVGPTYSDETAFKALRRSFHRSTSAYDNTTTTSTCDCSCIEHSIKPKY